MTEPTLTPRRSWADTLGFTLGAALLWCLAGGVMFSAFMYYDDEGYVLLSLRNFAEHGRLYREVYTQYGPFPFVVHYGVQLAGIELTHTVGRVLTLAAWGVAALACAGITGLATRNLALRLGILASTFVYLWVMASEPSHPGGLITALTALLAWLGARWICAGRHYAWASIAGAVTAALLLTKVNIGVFAAGSITAWLLLHFDHPPIRRWATPVLMLAIAALPFALMRPLLDAPWARTFALLFAVGGIMVIAASALTTTAFTTWKTVGVASASALVTGLVIVAVPLARGTSLQDLLEGVLLRPMRHPVQFSLPFTWPAPTWVAAGLGVVAFVVALGLRRRGKVVTADTVVAALRLAAAGALAATLARFPTLSPSSVVLAYAIPWLWIFGWSLQGEAPRAIAAARWVALLFLGQSLHAFPVPGSQIAWGTFLILPVVAAGAWSAGQWLAQQRQGFASRGGRRIVTAALAVFAVLIAGRLAQIASRYRHDHDLNLPGAERIRLPERSTAMYHLLTLNAVAHADVLFSLPGMFSFNLWTGLPTPTLANVTHWFSLLDRPQQEAIIQALETKPRACVIIQRGHLEFLAQRGLGAAGPLYDYLARTFVPAFVVDEFEFCIRRDRTDVSPLLLGEMMTSSQEATSSDADNTVFKIRLMPTGNQRVGSVEIAGVDGSPLKLDAASARVEITPTNLRGDPTGPAAASSWPFALREPAVVSLYFNRLDRPRPVKGGLIVVRNSHGAEIALGRLRE